MELSKEEEETGGKGMLGKSDSGKETGLKHRVITGRSYLISTELRIRKFTWRSFHDFFDCDCCA